MSNPTILTQFGNPDPSVTIQTTQQLIDLLNALVTSALQGSYVPYVIGSTTPIVADQDKAWIRIDNSGRPKGTYVFYNGSWRKSPTGLTSEVRVFTGDPAVYFDTSGLGKTNPDDWDGWAICNGNNGTTDLSNLFLVGGDMNNGATPPLVGGYSAGWTTKVTGNTLKTGGASDYLLANNNFPHIDIQVTGKAYQSGANTGQPRAIVTADWSGADKVDPNPIATLGANPGASPPVPQVAISRSSGFRQVARMWTLVMVPENFPVRLVEPVQENL